MVWASITVEMKLCKGEEREVGEGFGEQGRNKARSAKGGGVLSRESWRDKRAREDDCGAIGFVRVRACALD